MKLDSLDCEQILLNDTGQSINKLTAADLNANSTNDCLGSGEDETPVLANTKEAQVATTEARKSACLDSKPKQSSGVKKTICKFKDCF